MVEPCGAIMGTASRFCDASRRGGARRPPSLKPALQETVNRAGDLPDSGGIIDAAGSPAGF